MKKMIRKIVGFIILFLVYFNNFCYADIVVPDSPREKGSPIKMIVVGGILLVVVVTSIVILAKKEEKDESEENKEK